MAFTPMLALQTGHNLTLSMQMRQAIDVLKYSNTQLSDHLRRSAQDNPFIRLPRINRLGSGSVSGDGFMAVGTPSLHEFVARQIRMTVSDPTNLAISFAFAEALEPTGYLGKPMAEIAVSAGATIPQAQAVLEVLQGLEPTGIFAQNLKECLRLQAVEQDCYDGVMAQVITNLHQMTQGGAHSIAQDCGLRIDTVNDCLAQIRHFDPKPGLKFSSDVVIVREPDVLVSKEGLGWNIELNRLTMPGVTVNAASMFPKAGLIDGVSARSALTAAKWLAQAVQQRNATTLRVTASAVAWQSQFIGGGEALLRPMRCKDIAQTTGLHESTVSRVSSGLLLQTPLGMITMKSLFSRAVGNGGASAAAVRSQLREIIRKENPDRPISDMSIAKKLATDGVCISRRTVAKYRFILGIPVRKLRRNK